MSRSNQDLQQRRDAAFARGLGNQLPVYVDRARNAELWDVEGRRYIDFAAGIAVLNTGHLHPDVQAAVAKQLEAFSNTCLMVTPYACAVELAEKLNRLAPGPTPKKAIDERQHGDQEYRHVFLHSCARRDRGGVFQRLGEREPGGNRTIVFVGGRATRTDISQADGGAAFSVQREGDLNLIRVGDERYEIPDAAVSGG